MSDPKISTIGKYTFLGLMCDRFGKFIPTLFPLAYVCSLIY